jgi:hypothetical protein
LHGRNHDPRGEDCNWVKGAQAALELHKRRT